MQRPNLSIIAGCGVGACVLLALAAVVVFGVSSVWRGISARQALQARAQEFTEALFVKQDAAAAGALTCPSTRFPTYGSEWVAGEMRRAQGFQYRGFLYTLADDPASLAAAPGRAGADGHTGEVYVFVQYEHALAQPSSGNQTWLPRSFEFVLLREDDGTWCAWPGVEIQRE